MLWGDCVEGFTEVQIDECAIPGQQAGRNHIGGGSHAVSTLIQELCFGVVADHGARDSGVPSPGWLDELPWTADTHSSPPPSTSQ